MKKKRITLFDLVVHIIAIFLLVLVAYPLWLVLVNSVSDPSAVASGEVIFLPKGFHLDGYKEIFRNQDLLTGYANTIFYTVVGTLINLLVTVPCGYVMIKSTLPGRKIMLTYFMITMYFGGGLIPTFLLVNSLGMYNTRWAILILGAFNMYNCIICRSFFAGIPKELEESASIDGASTIRIFVQIILPLSKALLGVMVLYFAVGHWNSYFREMIYLREDSMQPLQVFLRRILLMAQQQLDAEDGEYLEELQKQEALIRYGIIVVASAPLLIVYPFLQKYFDKGALIGSVKG